MLLHLSKINAMQAIDMVVHNESSDTAIPTGTQLTYTCVNVHSEILFE